MPNSGGLSVFYAVIRGGVKRKAGIYAVLTPGRKAHKGIFSRERGVCWEAETPGTSPKKHQAPANAQTPGTSKVPGVFYLVPGVFCCPVPGVFFC